MLNIMERLDHGMFAPAVCVSRRGGKLDQEVERLGFPLIEAPFTIPARPYQSLLKRAWQAAQVVRPHKFALWHSFHYLDDWTEPIIARMAGARSWVYTKKNMNWYRRSWYLRTLLASGVAAQNHDMLEDFFAAPWFRGKTRLIPRGVDTIQFHPDTPARLGLRARLGIPAEAPLAGCVAHLVPVKGHPTLLKALAHVPDLHVVLAGKPLDGDYTALLERMVQELSLGGRVHFLGAVEDVPGLLAELDIAVLPTWARWRMEGCPVALLEAMACGKPCLATDIPGSRDLIEHGCSGLLVPPENPAALAAVLVQLVEDAALRRQLGAHARQRVLAHYRIEQETAAHVALYTELTSGIKRKGCLLQ